jgi:hypothetical protein
MTHRLVVTKSFLNFAPGDVIVDATKMNEILAGEHRKFVIKVVAPVQSEG